MKTDPYGFPTLTLRMEGMQYSIVQALHVHNQEIEAEVERQFKQIIEAENIEKMVRDAVSQVARAILADAVKDAVHKAMWSKDVKSLLDIHVQASLYKALNEYWPRSDSEEPQ